MEGWVVKGMSMAKAKPTVVEVLLQRSGTMKDYEVSTKLYKRYQKIKLKPKIEPKAKAELLERARSAEQSLERLYGVYQKVDEEMRALEAKKELSELYNKDEREAYATTIKKRLDEMIRIREELGEKKDGGTIATTG